MKNFLRVMVGITLLELMLVLAIAGVVIAMSVKYYQQAATNQRIAAGMGIVSSVVSAVESYRLTNKTIASIKQVSDIENFFPNTTIPISPWNNSEITLVGGTGNTYTMTISTTDKNACEIFAEQIKGQQGFDAKCDGGTTASITMKEGG